MCLDLVTKTNLNRSGKGWKLFEETGRDREVKSMFTNYLYKTGVWHTADSKKLESYTSGFHLFLTKRDALKYSPSAIHYSLYRVEYKKGHTLGRETCFYTDNRVPCLVANKMKILKRHV